MDCHIPFGKKKPGNVEKMYSFLYVGMSESGRKCYGNCYQPAHVLTWIDYISCFISMILAHCLWSAEVTGRKIMWFVKVRKTFSSGIHSISILSPEMSIWSSTWWLVSSFAQATQDSDREQLNLARLMTSHIGNLLDIRGADFFIENLKGSSSKCWPYFKGWSYLDMFRPCVCEGWQFSIFMC